MHFVDISDYQDFDASMKIKESLIELFSGKCTTFEYELGRRSQADFYMNIAVENRDDSFLKAVFEMFEFLEFRNKKGRQCI